MQLWKFALAPLSLAFGACAPHMNQSNVPQGISLGTSKDLYTTLWDTNGDSKPDILRWQRTTSSLYEKLDTDYDGFWDLERVRNPDGSYTTRVKYPAKAYPVGTHHQFSPLEDAAS